MERGEEGGERGKRNGDLKPHIRKSCIQ